MSGDQRYQLRHDILGCLNSIRLSLEVIGGANDVEEATEFLDCIAHEVSQVERIVELLFDDARAGASTPPASVYQMVAVRETLPNSGNSEAA